MSETIKKFSPLSPGLDCDPFAQIQRIFVYYLQSFFEHEKFRGTGMWWNKDEDVAELLISSEKPRLESLSKTPHISVVVGASAWGNLGMDQMQSRKMSKEERTHTDLVSSTVSYHCQGKEGNLSRTVAWYASKYTTVFRRMIMRQGGLHQIGTNHQISAESGPTAFLGKLSNEELVSVVVTIPFYWQPQWFIQEPREMFRRAETTFRVSSFQARPFRVKGRPAHSIPIDQYKSFEEAEEAVNPPAKFIQLVTNSED